ncbi:homeobox protein DBX2-like [Daktulosphaira vitifoliae]|uniref:homeobox protein DBX2-like n=1 Tax=Daktulosphaira vitifoliae TaxID=58002 RepID=UPI0021A982F8|nr:homeobox protein DBX2-like [Daktulosphaira vitifoliae]
MNNLKTNCSEASAKPLSFGIDRILDNYCFNKQQKKKGGRAVFTTKQKEWLEHYFQIEKYITKTNRKELATALGLNDSQVKVWFQNRRMKWRHDFGS